MFPYRLITAASLGAIVGSAARLGVGHIVSHTSVAANTTGTESVLHGLPAQQFPWATLAVNIIGALLIGCAAALPIIMANDVRRTFVVTGVLGGFTTFSALAVEAVLLSDQPLVATSYLLTTFVGGLSATHVGTWIVGNK